MSVAAFIIALLLLAGTVDPTRGWLIALTVPTGIAALRPRWFMPLMVRPALDARLATFIVAALLLAGAVEPTRDWLIALSALAGIAAFLPWLLSPRRLFDGGGWYGGRGRRWRDPWDDRRWARWERRFERELHRANAWDDWQ
jgi:hypothetical protein